MKNRNLKKERDLYNTGIELFEGDLLDTNVEVVVNAWNRNIIPWWLLLPQGVSGAIKKKGGTKPFRQLAKAGPIPLGNAVLTGAGRLEYKGIIHVAGINMLWRSSEKSIRACVQNAMNIVNEKGFASVAFPVIGAGSGGMNELKALKIMQDEFENVETNARVVVVRYNKRRKI